ncbi:MAG: NAD(P)-dependent oxidoreductase [Hyphomicrobiaceae bacterium]|nr:NAD(P)-dependent oxidoreductase [Hyphomicrobiaceae bacterium]
MTQPRIGIAGVGRMGTPMARRLLDAGYEVSVFDVNADAVQALVDAGASSAATPARLRGMADIVLMSLPMPAIVRDVALGENGIVKGSGASIVVDLSTTGPSVAREVAAGFQAAGIIPVDCPVSGGVGGAEKGTLAMMVGCASSVYPEVLPVLETLGKPTHIGEEPWMGQMLKVLNNIISVASLAIASEALVLGTKAGLDPEVMMDVINGGTGRTNATTDKIPKFVLTRSFDFGFAIGLSAKDLRLCIEESEAHGVPMVVGSAVKQLVNITKGRLGPDADLTEIIRPIEEWAGVEVAGKGQV